MMGAATAFSPILSSAHALSRAFHHPVSPDTRRQLRAAWGPLPEQLKVPNQFLGRQYAGCGATIGMMPRCDFACRGCYLGADANATPAQPVGEIKRQLRHLRAWLGEGGNVQLTDGEVTLRPEDELAELIRYAREVGLVPMVMSHGDTFRRKPGVLERLVEEAGLTELSLHVDITQRGRLGTAYKRAGAEEALTPLRDEFAQMIRDVRRRTGRRLEVATTFTVTRDNFKDVPSVIRWALRNADTFKMISFQPVAQVGRTEHRMGGSAAVEQLWARIAEGLRGTDDAHTLLEGSGLLGHPACSRFLQGLVVARAGAAPVFHPLFRWYDARDQAVVQRFLDRFGGVTFRLDRKPIALARLAGMIRQDPTLFFRELPPYLLRWLRRLDLVQPWRAIRDQTRVSYLNIVSHHFMDEAEIQTTLGRERLAQCVFRVPIGDRLMSMCEVNALGVRDRYYEAIRTAGSRAGSAEEAGAPVRRFTPGLRDDDIRELQAELEGSTR